MTWLDWVILLVIVVSIISSTLKGFAREVLSLASVIVGLLVASWFYPLAAGLFQPYVKTRDIASLLGFTLLFFGCVLLGVAISFIVQKLVKAVDLQWFDRLLGAAFGFVRGWIVGAVIFLMLTAFPVKLESVKNAKLSPYLLAGARALALVAPPELKAKFLEGYRVVEESWGSQTSLELPF
ncbi:MAG: CvpA family protein [Acidobacteriota bacterium]